MGGLPPAPRTPPAGACGAHQRHQLEGGPGVRSPCGEQRGPRTAAPPGGHRKPQETAGKLWGTVGSVAAHLS
eukprot:3342693-Alexandrium_andersonii.AAC.1